MTMTMTTTTKETAMGFGTLEGTGFEVIDPRFRDCFFPHERIERVWTGGRWCEGPAWFPAHQLLVWSDIPNDRMLRYDAINGVAGLFRAESRHANGNTVDPQGRLLTCEHRGRRVIRTEHDGRVTVIAERWEGRRLNSPNDLVVAADGAVWFTDPSYGILSDYEGGRAASETDGCHVYRVDPASGAVERVADDFVKPNGLAFSRDGRTLYVADTGASHDDDGPRHIRALEVTPDGRRLGRSRVFATCTAGLFDGFRVDDDDRVWASAADGVHVHASDGTLIGKVRLPEVAANLCFGGPRRNRLFVCATSSVYACHLTITG